MAVEKKMVKIELALYLESTICDYLTRSSLVHISMTQIHEL